MNILLLGSQHGNELLGTKLYAYIKKYRPQLLPHVAYKLANPRAFNAKVRFIESDMNRSYDTTESSYEAARAAHILAYIDSQAFDMVLDLHTTTCEQPPCIIVNTIQSENTKYIQGSSITAIVEMKHEIVKSSLIGKRSNALCIEVNEHDAESNLSVICDDIERFCNQQVLDASRDVYSVESLLKKDSISVADAKELVNFELSKFGYYPILVGENSYKKQTQYLGFKAYDKHVFKV